MLVKCPKCYHVFETNSISRTAVKCKICKRPFGRWRNSI